MSEEKCKYQNQTFGFVFCGEYNNQTYCCDVEDCYFKQNKRLREALERMIQITDFAYNKSELNVSKPYGRLVYEVHRGCKQALGE